MKNLTKNEEAALKAFYTSCLSNMGGTCLDDLRNDPFTWIAASDLIDAGWSKEEAAGTMSSLEKKGYIFNDDSPNVDPLAATWILDEDKDELAQFDA